MGLLKKILFIGAILFAVVLLLFDYQSRKRRFDSLKRELNHSIAFNRTVGFVNDYFFEHGWYPDSLAQVDTIFRHKINSLELEKVRNTPYRFLVDPFSGEFYRYIPIINKQFNKPEGFYLLSAGIDSKYDNKEGEGELKLYDSTYFNYFDSWFGAKDVMVKTESIKDWTTPPAGREASLSWLAKKIDPSGRRKMPRNLQFFGVVENIEVTHLNVRGTESNVKAICYFAPSHKFFELKHGDTVKVNGIYNKIGLDNDTTFTFLNCIILEK